MSRRHGQLVLIRGEAGIGKTRTMKELWGRARQRGFRAWIGAAYEAEGAPAYWPWVQILRASREELSGDVWRRHLPADAWATFLLMPELRGSARPSSEVDSLSARFQLFDELTRFLASASAAGPILVAVEDLHFADCGTAELLAHLARALEQHPVLLLSTLRDFEQNKDESLARAISRLERAATSVRLSGLSKEEILALLETPFRVKNPDAGVADVLVARARGNPFFIRQIVGLLLQRGKPIDSDSLATAELPTAVRDIIRHRLAELGNDARTALEVAAAAGQEFDAPLIGDVLGLTLEQALAALEPSIRIGVVAHQPAVRLFAFTHGLFRDALYDELGLARRGALHSKLARLLAARPACDARHLGAVAHHYLLAVPSQLEASARYCCEAAETARRASGFEAAADFLSKALQKLESEGGDERTRCELFLMLGFDHFCVANIDAGWRALGQGLMLARRIGDPHLVARFACSLVDWFEVGGFDEEEARAAVEEALLRAGDDAEMRAGLLARRARLGIELPVEERTALLDEATRLAERTGAVDVLLQVVLCRALLWNPTRIAEGQAAVAAHRALAAAHPSAAADPRFRLQRSAVDLSEYFYALTAGDLLLADQAASRFARTAERSPQMASGVILELVRAGRALRDRRFDDLDAAVRRLRESNHLTGALGRVWISYAFLSSEARNDFGAWKGIDFGDPSVLRELPARHRPGAYLWLAWFYAKTNRIEKARSFLAEIPRSELLHMPVRHGDLGLLCYLAEIYRAENDLDGAAWLRDKLMTHAALHAVGPAFEYRGPVLGYIRMLTSMVGD